MTDTPSKKLSTWAKVAIDDICTQVWIASGNPIPLDIRIWFWGSPTMTGFA